MLGVTLLGSAWLAGWVVAALLVPSWAMLGWVVAAAFGGAVAVLIMRSRARPVRRICQNLNRMSSEIQADLAQLQLQDSCGQLGAGWNRLIEEVVGARRELESFQIGQQARQTLGQYEMKWFSHLLNQIPHGLITVADDWLITFANTPAERLLGAAPGGLKGRKATEFFAHDLSHITPSSGIAIDQISELTSSPTLVRISAVMNDTERAETALLLQDVTHDPPDS
jgi:PAS domain-containing protein